MCVGACWAPADGGAPTCEYQGQVYPVGSVFPAGDGCNYCGCDEYGLVGCTAMACVCTGTEPGKHYVGKSAAQCAVMDFACGPNTSYFANQCGCGCQQDPSCPERYDCMDGSPPCDPAELARCPLTPVAV